MNDLPPDYVPSFSRLAAALGVSRGQLHDIRLRDDRFPKQTRSGWPVYGVAAFLHLRDLERMTDEDFRADGREDDRARLAALDAGRWADLGDGFVAKLRGEIQKTIDAAAVETPDERHARRKACTEDCIATMKKFSGAPDPFAVSGTCHALPPLESRLAPGGVQGHPPS